MKTVDTGFRNLLLIENTFHTDSRGGFMEAFNEAAFRINTNQNITFVQDNISVSAKNVIRGLHFQLPPKGQAKLVMVYKGAALDVVLDLRVTEPTYGKTFSIELKGSDHLQLFIPEGFAHGFLSLEDDTIFGYKCSNYYSPQHERCIRWNDESLNISWPVTSPLISDKDNLGLSFNDYTGDFL